MCFSMKYLCILLLVAPWYISNYVKIFTISTGNLFQADSYLNTHTHTHNRIYYVFYIIQNHRKILQIISLVIQKKFLIQNNIFREYNISCWGDKRNLWNELKSSSWIPDVFLKYQVSSLIFLRSLTRNSSKFSTCYRERFIIYLHCFVG